jgi:hypothetical protein
LKTLTSESPFESRKWQGLFFVAILLQCLEFDKKISKPAEVLEPEVVGDIAGDHVELVALPVDKVEQGAKSMVSKVDGSRVIGPDAV